MWWSRFFSGEAAPSLAETKEKSKKQKRILPGKQKKMNEMEKSQGASYETQTWGFSYKVENILLRMEEIPVMMKLK
jgi:hypothetical protein